MTRLEELRRCQHQLVASVLRLLTTEHEIALSASAASRIQAREDEVALAARNLVARIDDLEPRLRPRDWATAPGGEDA